MSSESQQIIDYSEWADDKGIFDEKRFQVNLLKMLHELVCAVESLQCTEILESISESVYNR